MQHREHLDEIAVGNRRFAEQGRGGRLVFVESLFRRIDHVPVARIADPQGRQHGHGDNPDYCETNRAQDRPSMFDGWIGRDPAGLAGDHRSQEVSKEIALA